MAAYSLVVVLSGVFIGAVGVGGVLLLPFLLILNLFGLQDRPQLAVNLLLCAYFPMGCSGLISYYRAGSIPFRPAVFTVLGVIPAAVAGANLLPLVPALVVSLIVAIIALFSGTKTLIEVSRQSGGKGSQKSLKNDLAKGSASDVKVEFVEGQEGDVEENLQNPQYENLWHFFCFGAFTGLTSVMTGTSGPFSLLPLIFTFRKDVRTVDAVGIGQIVAIPISLSATIVTILLKHSFVDIGYGLLFGLMLAVSLPMGSWLAHRLSQNVLRGAISVLLVVIGLVNLVRLVIGFFS